MKTTFMVSLLFILGFCAPMSRADDHFTPAPTMVGHWTGTADIVVNWTRQRMLNFDFVIARDGAVTGRIGEATLVNGRLATNRGWFGRSFHLATDYIIVGDLAGEILAAEHIHREPVKVPLNWSEDHFHGGLHTSGSTFGGRDKMILSAARLHLRRKDPAP